MGGRIRCVTDDDLSGAGLGSQPGRDIDAIRQRSEVRCTSLKSVPWTSLPPVRLHTPGDFAVLAGLL